jgi:methylated-DNA-[protein]-cysteine S-methyltransferase
MPIAASMLTTVFNTKLGWMGIVWNDGLVTRLTFGHSSPIDAARDISAAQVLRAEDLRCEYRHTIQQLRSFSDGELVDLAAIPVDLGGVRDFARCVLQACRRIPYGETRTYAGLAAVAGSPRASRAVGNVMAHNRIPLIIPCHRVVGAGNTLGGYSARAGLSMKKRLLAMEAVACTTHNER